MAQPEELEYQKVLKKYEIEQSKLPLEIRNKIKALAPLVGRYNAALKEGKPTEALNDAIIKQDIEIADLIVNFDETDLPTEEELLIKQEEDAAKLAAKRNPVLTEEQKKAAQKVADDAAKAKSDTDVANAKLESDKALEVSNTVKENEIKQILSTNSHKRIETSVLTKILGATPSNPITIGATKMRQVPFHSAYYEQV